MDRCAMCKISGETMDRLLLHCPEAKDIWNFFSFPVSPALGYAFHSGRFVILLELSVLKIQVGRGLEIGPAMCYVAYLVRKKC